MRDRDRVCVVHTPETAAPIKRAGTTSVIEMSSSETILRAPVVVSPHRRGGQRRYSKCVSAKQKSARYFLYYSSLARSRPRNLGACSRLAGSSNDPGIVERGD